jgi:hypothetical protein
MGSGLNFFVNSKLKWFEQREKEEKKISGSIFLCMKATIPGTHSNTFIVSQSVFQNSGWHGYIDYTDHFYFFI